MVSCVLFVGFLLVVVVPFKVGFRKAATCFTELLFLCVRDVEVSSFHPKRVDVNGTLPVIAMQVHVVLEIDERVNQGFCVGEEGFDFFSRMLSVGVEIHFNFILAVKAEP